MVKNLPAMQQTWVWSLVWEDPLEKGIATHSSILAWRIPWTEEPGGLQFMGLQIVRHDWSTNTCAFKIKLLNPRTIDALGCSRYTWIYIWVPPSKQRDCVILPAMDLIRPAMRLKAWPWDLELCVLAPKYKLGPWEACRDFLRGSNEEAGLSLCTKTGGVWMGAANTMES